MPPPTPRKPRPKKTDVLAPRASKIEKKAKAEADAQQSVREAFTNVSQVNVKKPLSDNPSTVRSRKQRASYVGIVKTFWDAKGADNTVGTLPRL